MKKIILFILIIFLLATIFGQQGRWNNELIVFAGTIYDNDKTIDYYQKFQNFQRDKIIEENKNLIDRLATINYPVWPDFLDNIIILQIESLNGFLVNETTTPNLIKIAQEGIFFPKFYSNSVETILAQETILCSLPNSFDFNISQNPGSDKTFCLPEIMNNIGFKTFFYKSYDLNFANTGKFMNYLRFQQVHADDIMKTSDPSLLWGWREDVFYQRVFEHLLTEVNQRYNFIFIEIGPTNHWPFKTPAGFEAQVPFSKPLNHRERLINTTFLQDKYLEIAWQKINELFPKKNYTLLILGDHSWPAEFHYKNTFNAKGAFEENFMTSMVMIIGDHYRNLVINNKYSEMDILPSLLDLFDLKFPSDLFRRSFLPEIKKATTAPATIIQIQPFNDKFINLVNDKIKYQYDSINRKFILCILEDDPDEKNCQIISQTRPDNLELIKKLLPIDNMNN